MDMEFIPELQAKLELLESRIGALLALVKELRLENVRLKADNVSLQQELIAGRSETETLHQNLAEAEQWKTEVQELKTSRAQVARRIEALLSLLDDLQLDITDKTTNL